MSQQLTNAPRILRRKEVQVRVGLARSSLYALIKKNQFPKPVKLSERSVGWLEKNVDDWIDSRTTKGAA